MIIIGQVRAALAGDASRWAALAQRESEKNVFEELLKQWANEQGFQTWSQDHAAVLRNLGKWLNQHAAQQNAHLTGFPPNHRDEPFCECDVCMGFVSRANRPQVA